MHGRAPSACSPGGGRSSPRGVGAAARRGDAAPPSVNAGTEVGRQHRSRRQGALPVLLQPLPPCRRRICSGPRWSPTGPSSRTRRSAPRRSAPERVVHPRPRCGPRRVETSACCIVSPRRRACSSPSTRRPTGRGGRVRPQGRRTSAMSWRCARHHGCPCRRCGSCRRGALLYAVVSFGFEPAEGVAERCVPNGAPAVRWSRRDRASCRARTCRPLLLRLLGAGRGVPRGDRRARGPWRRRGARSVPSPGPCCYATDWRSSASPASGRARRRSF